MANKLGLSKKSNLGLQNKIKSYDALSKKVLSKTNSIDYITKDRYAIPGSTPSNEENNNITTSTTTTTTTTMNPNSFVSVWRTTSPNETITLPVYDDGTTPSGVIDWGDGNVSPNTDGNYSHTYSSPGDYTISINGVMRTWRFVGIPSANNIIEILQWGCFNMGTANDAQFYGCSNLVLTNVTDVPNLTSVTSLSQTFIGCSSLSTVNRMNEWDVSGITTMSAMFNGATTFNQNISSWNISNVTDMSNMFRDTEFNQDISGWNVANVTNMNYMFNGAALFNQDLSSWCVTNIPSQPTGFATGATAWVLPKPIWGTCPITTTTSTTTTTTTV